MFKDWKTNLGSKGTPKNRTQRSNQNKKFHNYEQAKQYIKTLKIKSSTHWGEYKKINKIDPKMPKGPALVYKNKGWKGWGDFLGK